MNNEKVNSLIDKYLDGESSLSEEELLFQNAHHADDGIEAWSTFINYNRPKTPPNLNKAGWELIEHRRANKKRFIAIATSVAAGFLLFILIGVNDVSVKQGDFEKKKMLLDEAMAMLEQPNKRPSDGQIIYEDEIVVIYTSSE